MNEQHWYKSWDNCYQGILLFSPPLQRNTPDFILADQRMIQSRCKQTRHKPWPAPAFSVSIRLQLAANHAKGIYGFFSLRSQQLGSWELRAKVKWQGRILKWTPQQKTQALPFSQIRKLLRIHNPNAANCNQRRFRTDIILTPIISQWTFTKGVGGKLLDVLARTKEQHYYKDSTQIAFRLQHQLLQWNMTQIRN